MLLGLINDMWKQEYRIQAFQELWDTEISSNLMYTCNPVWIWKDLFAADIKTMVTITRSILNSLTRFNKSSSVYRSHSPGINQGCQNLTKLSRFHKFNLLSVWKGSMPEVSMSERPQPTYYSRFASVECKTGVKPEQGLNMFLQTLCE